MEVHSDAESVSPDKVADIVRARKTDAGMSKEQYAMRMHGFKGRPPSDVSSSAEHSRRASMFSEHSDSSPALGFHAASEDETDSDAYFDAQSSSRRSASVLSPTSPTAIIDQPPRRLSGAFGGLDGEREPAPPPDSDTTPHA